MNKPPDIKKLPDGSILDWYDKKFAKTIILPSDNDKKKKIDNILNSYEYKLENTFDTSNCSKIEKEKFVNKTICIPLKFTKNQIKIILSWIDECNDVFNFCVKDFNTNYDDWFILPKKLRNDIDYNKCSKEKYWYFNPAKIGYKKYKLEVFEELYECGEKGAPYSMLTNEVKSFCGNLKSCVSNLKENHISSYIMRKKNKNAKQRSIEVTKSSINEEGIFIRLLGKNNNLKDHLPKDKNELCDSRLMYNYKKKTFSLHLTKKFKIIKIDNREEFVSLDPGERIFLTYFFEKGYGFLGNDIYKILIPINRKIGIWQSILAKGINKKGEKLKNKKKIRKMIQNFYDKIKNIIRELHNKICLFLCKKFKRIIIPEFKTKGMCKGKINYIKGVGKKLEKNKDDLKELDEELKETVDKLNYLNEELKEFEKENKKSIKKLEIKKENSKNKKSINEIEKEITIINKESKLEIKKLENNIYKVENKIESTEEKIDKLKKERLEKLKGLLKIKKENRLNRKVKFVLNSMSHYRFRLLLIAKCKEYGCQLVIDTEEYTSMTCVKCGKISKVYDNRIKECKYCKTEIHRDVGGAINFAIKTKERICLRAIS